MNQSSNQNLSDLQQKPLIKPVLKSIDANPKSIIPKDPRKNARKLNTILLNEVENNIDMSAHGADNMNIMNKIILTEANIENELNNQDLNQDIKESRENDRTLLAASPGDYRNDHNNINDRMGREDVLQPSYRKTEIIQQREALLITPISTTDKIVIIEAPSHMQTPNKDLLM